MSKDLSELHAVVVDALAEADALCLIDVGIGLDSARIALERLVHPGALRDDAEQFERPD